MFQNRVAWVQIQGKDAADFLQRLSTLDIRSLNKGDSKPACFLDPTGRIQSYFYLHKQDDQNYYFEIENRDTDSHLHSLLAWIERFHFAEQFKIEALKMAPSGFKSQLEHSFEDRIKNNIPSWGFEIGPNVNPLEVNLRNAISEQKGCYPGQEVIEKIISLGEPARRLAKVKADSPFYESKLFSDIAMQNEIGTLTTTYQNFGLAIVRKSHAHVNQVLYQSNQLPVHIIEVT